MGKKEHDLFKQIKNKAQNEFGPLVNKYVDCRVCPDRENAALNKVAEEIYDLICEIDENNLYDSDKDEFYFYAYDITKQIGLCKLRKNHTFMFCGKEVDVQTIMMGAKIEAGDLEEVIGASEELENAIVFLEEALEYSKLSKTIDTTCNREIIENQLYHNICEALRCLNDNERYVQTLKKAIQNNDIRSVIELMEYYNRADAFDYNNYLELLNIFNEVCQHILAEQKSTNKNSKDSLNDIKVKEQFIMQCLFAFVDAFLSHAYYDKAFEIATAMKVDYKEYLIWNKKVEYETESYYNRCKKFIRVRNEEIVPADNKISAYFSQQAIDFMPNDIKIYLATALYVFDTLVGVNEFSVDFSPAIIPLFKALESILYKMTIDGYWEYMYAHKCEYERINASKHIYKKATNEFFMIAPDKFNLSVGIGILCWDYYTSDGEIIPKVNTGVIDFLKANGVEDVNCKKVIDFYNGVSACRDLRNKTAHKNRIYKTDADQARDIILLTTKVIEKAYLDFGNVLK